ncbi:hypothetical protein, partial [Salmonella enterica]|uniref:hypothetical protein n=1 Tax=Salmonella enterica TaxID=28901 RepID=UPI00398C407C
MSLYAEMHNTLEKNDTPQVNKKAERSQKNNRKEIWRGKKGKKKERKEKRKKGVEEKRETVSHNFNVTR